MRYRKRQRGLSRARWAAVMTVSALAVFRADAAQETNAPAAFKTFSVYEDGVPWTQKGAPSGWMGDFRDLRVNQLWTTDVHRGTACMKITYTAEGSRYANMVGFMWQHPANNDGTLDGGLDFRGARRLAFWARGEKGGELIETFFFGGTMGAYPDTDKVGINNIYLNREWTEYEVDLTGADLSYISCFFGWATGRFHNPDGIIFYLDDIRIE